MLDMDMNKDTIKDICKTQHETEVRNKDKTHVLGMFNKQKTDVGKLNTSNIKS